MFITPAERDDVDPESRYGEPQHEVSTGGGWEFEYYGEPEFPGSEPIEFLPEVEYPASFDGNGERAGTNRSVRSLSAGY